MNLRLLRTIGVTTALALASVAAMASSKLDHERARQALESGRAQSLQAVLAKVSRDYPGQVLEVELEEEEGMLLYEIKILQADGQLLKLYVNARTLDVTKMSTKPAKKRK
jgi:uncharacterized membrane protein YkoI